MLASWAAVKTEIVTNDGLNSLKFKELWPRMLSRFTDDYKPILILVAILLLVPTDTSECERIFSVMNDIKCHDRSRMLPETLRDLLLWYFHGQDLSHAQLPVREILTEWYQVLEEEKISYVRPQHAAQREGAQEHAERGPAQMPDGGLGA